MKVQIQISHYLNNYCIFDLIVYLDVQVDSVSLLWWVCLGFVHVTYVQTIRDVLMIAE